MLCSWNEENIVMFYYTEWSDTFVLTIVWDVWTGWILQADVTEHWYCPSESLWPEGISQQLQFYGALKYNFYTGLFKYQNNSKVI